jgi:Uma2 family endonuclease
MPLAQPKTHRWTVDQYHRMADMGFFRENRVELINGRITQMPPKREPHSIAVGLTVKSLEEAFGPGFWVRNQEPLRFTRYSEPEPDVAVVPGTIRDYVGRPHPDSALLIVEISDATLRYDQTRKLALYARHRIADYWILDLNARQLEIHRQPTQQPGRRSFRYADCTILGPSERISPLAVPHAQIQVSDLLP